MSRIIKDNNGNVTIVFDMAYERRDAINHCADVGKQFIDHFKKILQDPSKEAIHHHAEEMQGWLEDVSQIVLKHNKKQISNEQLIDWFFTKGSSVEILFSNDKKGKELYNNFIKEIIKDYNVVNTLKRIGLL